MRCEAIAVYASNSIKHATRMSREGRGKTNEKLDRIGYVGVFPSFVLLTSKLRRGFC